MSKPAAIYTRVSSDRQKEDHTIASQTAALEEKRKAFGPTAATNPRTDLCSEFLPR
jgi:DNA invertase Pin-like site-specific DNA recombinase